MTPATHRYLDLLRDRLARERAAWKLALVGSMDLPTTSGYHTCLRSAALLRQEGRPA